MNKNKASSDSRKRQREEAAILSGDSSSDGRTAPLQAHRVNTTTTAVAAASSSKARSGVKAPATAATAAHSSTAARRRLNSPVTAPHTTRGVRGRDATATSAAASHRSSSSSHGHGHGHDASNRTSDAGGSKGARPDTAGHWREKVAGRTASVWGFHRAQLEAEVGGLAALLADLQRDCSGMEDAIEAALAAHEGRMDDIATELATAAAAHAGEMRALEEREDRCRARESRAREEAQALATRAVDLRREQEAAREGLVVAAARQDEVRAAKAAAEAALAGARAEQQQHLAAEERMKDAAYGLTGEVRDMVIEMEALERQRREAEVSAMEVELTRRVLYARCEELKGSIRVYCRVRGRKPKPQSATADGSAPLSLRGNDKEEEEREGDDDEEEVKGAMTPSAFSERASVSSDSTTTTTTHQRRRCASAAGRNAQRRRQQLDGDQESVRTNNNANRDDDCAGDDDESDGPPLYTFPLPSSVTDKASGKSDDGGGPTEEEEAALAVPRSITVHQTRSNATSTGLHSSTESFTYDRVFDASASQAEVYADIEPLVNSAVDGYRVCLFAYGQTGSGKTYTMEGDVSGRHSIISKKTRTGDGEGIITSSSNNNEGEIDDSGFGVTPRALRTVFERQAALAHEGWEYELSCYFVEIYNDVIRDLFQSPAVYDSGAGAGNGNSAYHTIKQDSESGTTTITNVKERKLRNMSEFLTAYRQGVRNRRTARTQLNERSSRSHCIFTLHIRGTNATIRQRSDGVLCVVDLAGSERVNESGVQGAQLREAININKSLLDLGKCIYALRGGSVVPWRNCRLTHLLQNYLGARGGKMLMIVNISDSKKNVGESVNALRFAQRVSETVIGTSTKRVTTY